MGHSSTQSDWPCKWKFYNATASSDIQVGTSSHGGNIVPATGQHQSVADSSGDMGMPQVTLIAQTTGVGVAGSVVFKLQAYSGRNTFYINKTVTENNDDITGTRMTSSFLVQEVAG